jgi:hypothetical protein
MRYFNELLESLAMRLGLPLTKRRRALAVQARRNLITASGSHGERPAWLVGARAVRKDTPDDRVMLVSVLRLRDLRLPMLGDIQRKSFSRRGIAPRTARVG